MEGIGRVITISPTSPMTRRPLSDQDWTATPSSGP